MPTLTLHKVRVIKKPRLKIKLKKNKTMGNISLNISNIPGEIVSGGACKLNEQSEGPSVKTSPKPSRGPSAGHSVDNPVIDSDIVNKSPEEDDNIHYGEHYISFLVLYNFNYGFRKTETPTNYVIGTSILFDKHNNGVHNHRIKISQDFKYKKYIRDFVRNEMNYKNKDIYLIKSVNVYKNYHNYIIVLNSLSKKHKQYKNLINDTSYTYKWRNIYDFYPSNELNNYGHTTSSNTMTKAYIYLYKKGNNIIFNNSVKDNNISLKETYKILHDIG